MSPLFVLNKITKMAELNRFQTGGTHAENPNGGIPINKNTVEEDETKYNNFVFSNRIKVNKDLLEQFNLPGYIANKTYADASKVIDNKFKDRKDKYSNETKDSLMSRLSEAHEYVKLQENLKANSTQVEDEMNGQIPEGFENQMFFGGNVADIINPALSLNQQMKGTGNTNNGSSTLNGAMTGLSLGAMFGPLGGGIGALVGAGSGLLGAGKSRRNELNTNKNLAIANSGLTNDFALGGELPDPSTFNIEDYNPFNKLRQNPLQSTADFAYKLGEDNAITEAIPTEAQPLNIQPEATPGYVSPYPKANLKPALDWLGNNYGDIMRLAPVATNIGQLAGMKKPQYEKLDRLNNRFKPEYVDERTIQNTIGNGLDNTVNALTNATNGSQGALRNNILGAGLNRDKALSDAYISSSNINRQQNIAGQQFNLGVDQTNLGQSNQELDINDRNKGAYDTNKSRLISQIGTDIGNIGKEEVYKKIARETYGYRWDGTYWIKPDGSKSTDEEMKKEVSNQQSAMKMGGFLKKY